MLVHFAIGKRPDGLPPPGCRLRTARLNAYPSSVVAIVDRPENSARVPADWEARVRRRNELLGPTKAVAGRESGRASCISLVSLECRGDRQGGRLGARARRVAAPGGRARQRLRDPRVVPGGAQGTPRGRGTRRCRHARERRRGAGAPAPGGLPLQERLPSALLPGHPVRRHLPSRGRAARRG